MGYVRVERGESPVAATPQPTLGEHTPTGIGIIAFTGNGLPCFGQSTQTLSVFRRVLGADNDFVLVIKCLL